MQQRLFGYAGCGCFGMMLNFGSWIRLKDLMHGEPTPFVLMFTIGNIIIIAGAFFYNGPYTQAKKMVSKQLCCATFSFLAAMCLTLVVAYSPGIKSPTGRVFLCLIFIFIQYVCQIWFVICSVAILKTIVTRCLRSYCATCCPTWVSNGCKKCCSMLDDAQDAVGDAVSSAAGSKPPASKSDRAGFFPTSAMV